MRLLNKLLLPIPRPLPLGMNEFEKWSTRIIDLSGKFADEDSMKFALASQVLHLGAQVSSKPDLYFVRSLKKAAANQVSSAVFQAIKQKQQDELLKAQKANAESSENATEKT